jgi:Transglutaminase-like superfamily
MHRSAWTLAAVLLAGAAHGQNAPLFAIPTESAAVKPIAADEPLTVALYSRDLPQLAQALGIDSPAPTAERLEYTFAEYPQLRAAAGRSWLESTFVVDYEEPGPVQLYDELLESKGEQPSRKDVVEFAAATVKGVIGRGWDIASTVARNREGDCSEYAVTTAALARAVKLPSRVVVGMVVVHNPEHGYATYGHAWAEVKEGGRWVVADAALANVPSTIRYLPFGVLTNEGPGFMLDLAGLMNFWVQRVVVLGTAQQTRSSDARH